MCVVARDDKDYCSGTYVGGKRRVWLQWICFVWVVLLFENMRFLVLTIRWLGVGTAGSLAERVTPAGWYGEEHCVRVSVVSPVLVWTGMFQQEPAHSSRILLESAVALLRLYPL